MMLAWNPFDPVGSFKDVLVDMSKYMLKQFEQVIVHPPRFSDKGILPAIYGSGNQLTLYIAWIVLLFAIFVGMMFFRKGGRIGMALVNWLLLSAALPVWVTIVNQMSDAGDKASEGALLLGQNLPENGHFGLPVLDNVGWYILCLLGGIGWGSLLSMFIASYEFLIIVLKFWGPIAYAFGTLGTRAKQFSNMILSFGLVATIVGRPFAIFFLELGQVALQTTPLGKVGFFAMAFVVGSYVAAFVSQIVLFFVCYKGISAIEGFIGARIRGTTETLIRQTIRVDVQNIRKNNRAGLHPVPVPVPVRRQMVQDAKTRAKREGAKAAARKATTVASAAALATGHPAAGAAINKAGGNFFGKKPSDTNT